MKPPVATGSSACLPQAYSALSREARLGARLVYLSGAIEQEKADRVIADLLRLADQDSSSDINFYLDSSGGNFDPAWEICETMQQVSPDIRTVCIEEAHSAASLIFP